VLRQAHSRETLSIQDIPAEDDALAGALMGAADNNTTGKFTGQTFATVDIKLSEGEDAGAALDKLVSEGARLIIADLSADALLKASERAKISGALLFNISPPTKVCARKTAAQMSCMSRPRGACWPTASRNI